MITQKDSHHCHCFSIDKLDLDEFREQLKEIGFKNIFWQNVADFKFGLVLRIDEFTQMHVKVNAEGKIEAEIEYPPDYPIAHLNQKHCYSAHHKLQEIFKNMSISYKSILFSPMSCLRPKIIAAINPSHATTIAGVSIAIMGAGALTYLAVRKIKKE